VGPQHHLNPLGLLKLQDHACVAAAAGVEPLQQRLHRTWQQQLLLQHQVGADVLPAAPCLGLGLRLGVGLQQQQLLAWGLVRHRLHPQTPKS
jgi:hypothetical protein